MLQNDRMLNREARIKTKLAFSIRMQRQREREREREGDCQKEHNKETSSPHLGSCFLLAGRCAPALPQQARILGEPCYEVTASPYVSPFSYVYVFQGCLKHIANPHYPSYIASNGACMLLLVCLLAHLVYKFPALQRSPNTGQFGC